MKYLKSLACVLLVSVSFGCSHSGRVPASDSRGNVNGEACTALTEAATEIDILGNSGQISEEERLKRRLPLYNEYQKLNCGKKNPRLEKNVRSECKVLTEAAAEIDLLEFSGKISEDERLKRRLPLYDEYHRLGCK